MISLILWWNCKTKKYANDNQIIVYRTLFTCSDPYLLNIFSKNSHLSVKNSWLKGYKTMYQKG